MEFEHRGETYYSSKNYTNATYKYDLVRSQNINAMVFSDFVGNLAVAKAKCLAEAEREIDQPMMAVERDEEYFPTFKECVKTTIVDFLAFRAQGPGPAMGKLTLTEENADTAVEKGLDMIKLNELKETDLGVYSTFLEELKGKYEQ